MEAYTLTQWLTKDQVIEDFESLIWTERFSAAGEITLVVKDSPANRILLYEGAFVGLSESREVMLLETLSIADGMMTLVGKTLLAFLKNRPVKNTTSNNVSNWTLTGFTPGDACARIVMAMCSSGYTGTDSWRSLVTNGDQDLMAIDYGPSAPGTPTNITVPFTNVYDVIKTICDSNTMGMSLYPSTLLPPVWSLSFSTYLGTDRTSQQNKVPLVRFDSAADSLNATKELRSLEGYKNVVYAFPPNNPTIIATVGYAYAPGAGSTRNFQRRSMSVYLNQLNITDVTTQAGAQAASDQLTQLAADTLANNNYVRMVDGELVPQPDYIYGQSYGLGDIIELRTQGSPPTRARITEYIRSKDRASGEKAYPTLSVLD